MLSEFPWQWMIVTVAAYVALRCIMSLGTRLRDHLQGLLVEHVKRQQIESKKKKRIQELREAIRKKKAAALEESERKAA